MTESAEKEKTETLMKVAAIESPDANKAAPEPTGWRKMIPKPILDNATQISNAGLMFFTGSMLFSGYRGKQISEKIYTQQIELLKESGFKDDALAKKTEELLKSKVIKKPGWHMMRLVYLLTAMTSFAFGAIFKRKEEKPEDLIRYDKMSLPEYMVERTKEAFDPVHHSRQTVGVLAGTSGVMAVTSALSQPGGVHKSELYVGTTLAVGGALLAYVKDATAAQSLFTFAWLSRLPAILTGTNESMNFKPGFKHPLVADMKKTPAYFEGAGKALREGHPETIWLGLRKVHRTGPAAVRAYDAQFAGLTLPEKRNDIAYPFGQWGNLFSAFLGIAGRPTAKPSKSDHASDVAPAQQISSDTPQTMVNTVHKTSEERVVATSGYERHA